MANTVGRMLKSDILTTWAPLEALGSGIDQLFMVSNINHLGDESNYRTLCSVPGFGVGGVQITRNSPTGAGVASPPTTPSDFDWFSPRQYFPSVVPYSAVTSLGTHVVHRLAREESVWPDLVLRCRMHDRGRRGFRPRGRGRGRDLGGAARQRHRRDEREGSCDGTRPPDDRSAHGLPPKGAFGRPAG